jgi:hypothetical protein
MFQPIMIAAKGIFQRRARMNSFTAAIQKERRATFHAGVNSDRRSSNSALPLRWFSTFAVN